MAGRGAGKFRSITSSDCGEARTLNQWLKRTDPRSRFSQPMYCHFRRIHWLSIYTSTLEFLNTFQSTVWGKPVNAYQSQYTRFLGWEIYGLNTSLALMLHTPLRLSVIAGHRQSEISGRTNVVGINFRISFTTDASFFWQAWICEDRFHWA